MSNFDKKWVCNWCKKTFTDIADMYDTGTPETLPLCMDCVDKKPMPK